jgi:mono/diheme cytochrome c family protein
MTSPDDTRSPVLSLAPYVIAVGLIGAVAMLVFIGLISEPVTNPAITEEPAWNVPQTEELARRACYDCHSNEVKVPWYGSVPPITLLVSYDVSAGRSDLNFSEMDRDQPEAHEAGGEVREGEMPPRAYVLMHPEARLTDAERRALAEGLDATLGGEEHQDGHDQDDDSDSDSDSD